MSEPLKLHQWNDGNADGSFQCFVCGQTTRCCQALCPGVKKSTPLIEAVKLEPAAELCQSCGQPAIPGTGGCPECTKYAVDFVMQTHQPTFTSVDEEILRLALVVAENTKEFATELLTTHDQNLGRTTRKNLLWAEHLEQCIRQADRSIKELRDSLGFT